MSGQFAKPKASKTGGDHFCSVTGRVTNRWCFFQTEWPRRTRAYEYGVYVDQVLQNFFMPGMYVITNLANA